MKLKSLFFVIAAGIGCSAFAYTWTGGGIDGLWTTPANWGVTSGYPQNADDPIIFNGSATVSLNTGAQTDIAYIKVTAGNVVLTAIEGSSLKINWPGNGNPAGKPNWGITVADGASLDFAVPLATPEKENISQPSSSTELNTVYSALSPRIETPSAVLLSPSAVLPLPPAFQFSPPAVQLLPRACQYPM